MEARTPFDGVFMFEFSTPRAAAGFATREGTGLQN